MDEDEKWLVNHLVEEATSTADRLMCIQTLEALLLEEAVPYLVIVLKNKTFSNEIRERAAKAIPTIGGTDVQKELSALRSTASPTLLHLLNLAQGKVQ